MDAKKRNREEMSCTMDESEKHGSDHAEVLIPIPSLAWMVYDVDLALSVELRTENLEGTSQVSDETSLEVLADLQNALASQLVLNRLGALALNDLHSSLAKMDRLGRDCVSRRFIPDPARVARASVAMNVS